MYWETIRHTLETAISVIVTVALYLSLSSPTDAGVNPPAPGVEDGEGLGKGAITAKPRATWQEIGPIDSEMHREILYHPTKVTIVLIKTLKKQNERYDWWI